MLNELFLRTGKCKSDNTIFLNIKMAQEFEIHHLRKIQSRELVNTMATDALAPCVARTSAAIVFNKQDKHEGFQPCYFNVEKLSKMQIYFTFPKRDSAHQGVKVTYYSLHY